MSLAAWIMDTATRNPPAGREGWAKAMRAEFEVLESDRLEWALGCWRTMAGWRLQRGWPVAVGLSVLPLVLHEASGPLMFQLMILLDDEFLHANLYGLSLAEAGLMAAILAACFPRHRRKAALAAFVAPSVLRYVTLMQMNDWKPFREWLIFDGSPLVGFMAILCACWIGAAAGAWIGARLRAITPGPAAA